MALHDDISNQIIESAINSINTDAFTTFTVITYLEKNYPDLIQDIKVWSPRNWRSVIGKAIKRYSIETEKVKQVSPSNETPARWKKNYNKK